MHSSQLRISDNARYSFIKTRNSSVDERANVNFLYDDIAHALNKKEKDKTNSWAVVI